MKLLVILFLLVLLVSACVSAAHERQDFGYYLTWSPDDELLAVTTQTGLYLYETHTFKQVAAFPGFSGSTVAFADGYMAAINGDGMYVWNLRDYSLHLQEKSKEPIQFQSISIHPDGQWLVTGEQKQFRIWNLPERKVVASFPVDGFVSNAAFTGKDTLIVIEQYKAVVQEWDLEKQEKIRSFEIPRDVLFFTLSNDGRVVLVDYCDAGVEMWNVETGEPTHYYQGMQGASGWTRLSGDNRIGVVWGYAVDGDHSGMGVWDLAQDHRIHEFSTPFVNGDGWRYGAINSNSTFLAASNNEGYIYFFDLTTGQKIGEIYLPYEFEV